MEKVNVDSPEWPRSDLVGLLPRDHLLCLGLNAALAVKGQRAFDPNAICVRHEPFQRFLTKVAASEVPSECISVARRAWGRGRGREGSFWRAVFDDVLLRSLFEEEDDLPVLDYSVVDIVPAVASSLESFVRNYVGVESRNVRYFQKLEEARTGGGGRSNENLSVSFDVTDVVSSQQCLWRIEQDKGASFEAVRRVADVNW